MVSKFNNHEIDVISLLLLLVFSWPNTIFCCCANHYIPFALDASFTESHAIHAYYTPIKTGLYATNFEEILPQSLLTDYPPFGSSILNISTGSRINP